MINRFVILYYYDRVGSDYEAMFDPWSYLIAAKKKAQSLGVRYVEAEVKGMKRTGNRIENVSVSKSYYDLFI